MNYAVTEAGLETVCYSVGPDCSSRKTSDSAGPLGRCVIWNFTIYGFFSIACANRPDGTIDAETVMVRARLKKHLENLKVRFSALENEEILIWPNRDYYYRLIVPKTVWAEVLKEMAEEQEWSNFKNQAASRRAQVGSCYIRALHDVWETMYDLQESETASRD